MAIISLQQSWLPSAACAIRWKGAAPQVCVSPWLLTGLAHCLHHVGPPGGEAVPGVEGHSGTAGRAHCKVSGVLVGPSSVWLLMISVSASAVVSVLVPLSWTAPVEPLRPNLFCTRNLIFSDSVWQASRTAVVASLSHALSHLFLVVPAGPPCWALARGQAQSPAAFMVEQLAATQGTEPRAQCF